MDTVSKKIEMNTQIKKIANPADPEKFVIDFRLFILEYSVK